MINTPGTLKGQNDGNVYDMKVSVEGSVPWTGPFLSIGFTLYEENQGGSGIYEPRSDSSHCIRSTTVFSWHIWRGSVCCDDGMIHRNSCSNDAWLMVGQQWVDGCIGLSWNNNKRNSRYNANSISCHQNSLCSPSDHWDIVYSTKECLCSRPIICTCTPWTPGFQNIE